MLKRAVPPALVAAFLLVVPAAPGWGQTVTFDFDTGTPALSTGQSLPLIQTSGGVTAAFSSPQGFAFSIQSDATTYYRMSQFSGKYLWPNSINRNALHIVFDQHLVSVTLVFATVDYQDNAEIPGNLLLSAYDASTGALVGTATTHGAYLGDTYPMGTLSFVTTGAPFDVIDLVVPPQPQGTTNFLADNITVTTSLLPPLEVSGPASPAPLEFTTTQDMIWEDASASHAASFNLYRGDLDLLLQGSYGTCFAASIPVSGAADAGAPLEGAGWFYLVTARNALGEGTMGAGSSGVERLNANPCP